MPAERARHAKRLGHIQNGSGPVVPILADKNAKTTTTPNSRDTTTISIQIPTSAATKQPSSSALPSSTPTPTLSPASSSSTINALTSSGAPSTIEFLTTTSTGPSSLVSQHTSTPVVVISASPTTSSTSVPQTNAAATSSSGLSGGAIAGIVAASIIAGVALVVFFVRKTYLRRRDHKHISRSGALGFGPEGILDKPKPLQDLSEKPASVTGVGSGPKRGPPMSPFEAHGQSMYTAPPPPVMHPHSPYVPYAVPAPLQATYNNPVPITSYSPQPASPTYNPGNTAALAMARAAAGAGTPSPIPSSPRQQPPVEATVRCTFVPTLPDELSIITGERIRVVARYDDGWAMCANGRGEQGMVPQECLEHVVTDQAETDWRNARRMSSLNPGGKRF
ncbi:hypothetical protein BU15DRAFT_39726 [Melanogaster broomeanus]|nr:hypothetical protein BU15DRAFT_39726 [Melanogaster broomeanus]